MVCSDPADSYKLLPRPHQIMGLLTENDESCEKPDFPEEGETGTREHLVIFLRGRIFGFHIPASPAPRIESVRAHSNWQVERVDRGERNPVVG